MQNEQAMSASLQQPTQFNIITQSSSFGQHHFEAHGQHSSRLAAIPATASFPWFLQWSLAAAMSARTTPRASTFTTSR
jgi:hypothetical protein